MKVKTDYCHACKDDRVDLSMTRNEAEILLLEMRITYTTTVMMKRALAKLEGVLGAPKKDAKK